MRTIRALAFTLLITPLVGILIAVFALYLFAGILLWIATSTMAYVMEILGVDPKSIRDFETAAKNLVE